MPGGFRPTCAGFDAYVLWGGTNDAAATGDWPLGYTQAAAVAAAAVRPATGIAGYAVFYDGQAVDASHPLVVTSQIARQPIALTVSAVNAQGVAVASAQNVSVLVSDGGAGGTIGGPIGPGYALTLDQGGKGTTFTYTNPKPGSYVLVAIPDVYQEPGFAPSVPAFLPAHGTATATVELVDPNGVVDPLPPGATMTVTMAVAGSALGDGVRGRTVAPTLVAPGVYAATFSLPDGPAEAAFSMQLMYDGQTLGNPSSSAHAVVTQGAAPALTASPSARGIALHVTPSGGEKPIAYALFRVQGQKASVAAGAVPVAVVDAASAANPTASYIDPVPSGTYTYFAIGLCAEGSYGAPSAPVSVAG